MIRSTKRNVFSYLYRFKSKKKSVRKVYDFPVFFFFWTFMYIHQEFSQLQYFLIKIGLCMYHTIQCLLTNISNANKHSKKKILRKINIVKTPKWECIPLEQVTKNLLLNLTWYLHLSYLVFSHSFLIPWKYSFHIVSCFIILLNPIPNWSW